MGRRFMLSAEKARIARGHGKTGYIRIGVDLPVDLHDALAAKAARQGTSVQAQLRTAVRRWVEP